MSHFENIMDRSQN